MMERRKVKFMYLGKYFSNDVVRHAYAELSESFEYNGKKWSFKKKIFNKGIVGSLYDVEVENDICYFKKTQYPTSFIEVDGVHTDTSIVFDWLAKYREIHRQTMTIEKLSKSKDNLVDNQINELRSLYLKLSRTQRDLFIANVIYKITK